MKSGTVIFIIVFGFCGILNAQDLSKHNIVGSNISFQSEVMDDERDIQVYLPNGYSDSQEAYPVLYILDGQRYFLHAVSLQQTFNEFKQTPDFIVVGISKKRSDRNRFYSSESNTYSQFIESEVISRIDSQFRTTDKRLLFGWAYGGGFVFDMMVSKPNLFDAYIAASPFPIQNKFQKIDSLFTIHPNINKMLFFTSAINEGVVKEETNQLNDLLTEKVPITANWEFVEFDEEEHRSTPFTTLYHGLRKYFHFYPELQFSNLEEFINAGGLDYTYDYYSKRSDQYGFPKELSDWTMFSIVRNAIRADNYSQFDSLVNEFRHTDFVSRLRVSRACSVAEFYINNNQYEKAKNLYLLIAKHNPDAIMPQTGLGDVYMKLGDEKKANSFYEKAESLKK